MAHGFICGESKLQELAKLEEVSKYYETDSLQNFLLYFMVLLTAKFFKNCPV